MLYENFEKIQKFRKKVDTTISDIRKTYNNQ